MTPLVSASTLGTLRHLADSAPGLDLLLLFGSRARADGHPQSDWDFAYLAADPFDPAALLGSIIMAVGTDRVDLVDLRQAGGLLRYRAARDGLLVLEARRGLAERFCLEAAQFWCDAAPVLERGYEQVLAELKR
jgi:hypothetical protein